MENKTQSKYFRIVQTNTVVECPRYQELRKQWDHYTATLELAPAPLHVDIEVTSACNLRCAMCERNKMRRSVGFMEYEFFRSIIDQCVSSGVYSIKLEGWGESLLHKDIFKMIEYAKKKDRYVMFNTNTTLVAEPVIRKLIASGLDAITLSVESADKQVYETIRRGADRDKTIDNLDTFVGLKPLGERPLIRLQILQMKKNIGYVANLAERYKEKVDFISMTNVTSASGDPDILKESLIDYTALTKNPCSQLWQRLVIFWNGDVTVCCADYDGVLKIGRIQESTIKELWVHPKLNELRARHKRRDFSNLLCSRCTANYTCK